ncbi:hypothetical protein TTHERM_001502009 (macronuclear) [Tetrahymena thermophila SB210]|uniref:Uncharacterized protein n=1 Tax=Tetrahymena thermophila (strain SB210) TaxID=312017 RepID=W7XD68_TETTS|nr:hypothetical protein TTHERM_001502009 [Tetrahymena thermophila SB210]EWS71766.1 hypothetical protein TTHERM_001502009 [Tetrahymena thermophila SB210]|eukprot:XP_012655697.1 hypothetical protein TTHERM_001502009 [Tetrahymena thermophila SB210]
MNVKIYQMSSLNKIYINAIINRELNKDESIVLAYKQIYRYIMNQQILDRQTHPKIKIIIGVVYHSGQINQSNHKFYDKS